MKHEIPISKITYKTKSGYTRFVKRHFENKGFTTRPAIYDEDGNCIFCGESGRCAGIHGIKFDYYSGGSDEF